ncbi:MAG TPA: DUF885 family protein [Polyangiaceae bacterium]
MRLSHPATALLFALLACHEPSVPQAVTPAPSTAPLVAPIASPPASAPSLDARRAQLGQIIAERWDYTMRTSPEWASTLGDKRYNDRWSDYSEKFVMDDLAESRKYLARLEAVDTTGFPEQERLSEVLLARKLRLALEGARFEDWLMPVNQFDSPHLNMAELVSLLPFTSVKDYDDYLTRLRTLPVVLDQVVVLMRAGMAKGLIPPKILLGKVAQQADDVAAAAPEASAFAAPLRSFPAAVPEVDRVRIRAACLAAIKGEVNPAYRRFATFVRAEYEPHGRAEPGAWSLPLGPERYAFQVKDTTTTDLTPDAIHEIGLREVARIETEMHAVAKQLGYSDLKSLAASVAKNPALHFKSREGILDLYRRYTDGMYGKLPALFGRLPKAKLEFLPVEQFREKSFAAAAYDQGTPDGSRPGHVMVNTGDFAKRTTLSVETTAYHEGVPGHHLQISIAQEVPDLPQFRQQYSVTAYIEGWALYSERLGEEVGLYQDPYSRYGHLQDEMLRAIRLVVDTGLHAKKWTRQQVVDYFHAHSTIDEVDVQAETDRYIAIPSQALAYKIGQLKLLELREKAKKALGDRFDIRAFHDVVLGSGALPLDVLEQQVDRWIAGQRAG